MNKKKRFKIDLFFIIILISASALRIYNINKYDLWFDELGSSKYSYQNIKKASQIFNLSEKDIFLSNSKNDPHSTFYYLIVYLFTFIFKNHLNLRFISVFSSILSILAIYKLSRFLFDKETGIYASLLMALSPFQIWYAQEARAYALSSFLSILMIFYIFKSLNSNKIKDWILLTLISYISILISYYSFLFILCSLFIVLSPNNKTKFSNWFYSFIAIIIPTCLYSYLFKSHFDFVKNDFWLSEPSLITILNTFQVYSLGYFGKTEQLLAGSLLFLSLFLYGIYSSFKINKGHAYSILGLLIFPLAFIYIFSKIFTPIYLNRQLIIFAPLYYLFIGIGIRSIKLKKEKIITVTLSLAFLLFFCLKYYFTYDPYSSINTNLMEAAFYKNNYKKTINQMLDRYENGDLLIATGMHAYQILYLKILESEMIDPKSFYFLFIPEHISFTNFSKRHLKLKKTEKTVLSDNRDKVHYIKPFDSMEAIQAELYNLDQINPKRLWLVTSKIHKKIALSENTLKIINFIQKNFKKSFSTAEDEYLVLELYEMKK